MSQNRDDLPYFPYYASNIVADKRYRLMKPIERALWISIYLECWPNGSVPADPVDLAKYLGYSMEEVKAGLTDRVLSFFKEVDGDLISPQLEEYWGKVVKRREKQAEGGKKGAKQRWDKPSEPIPQPMGEPIPQPMGELMGSLNTIKSNTLKSNTSPIEGLDPVLDSDSWVDEYDAASKESIPVTDNAWRL